MEKHEVEMFRILLTERLNTLMDGAGAAFGELTEVREPQPDTIDVAASESNRDFVLRLKDRERHLIRKIQIALRRMNDGEYGFCIACGEDISQRRLLARPFATHCIDCKTEAEQLHSRHRSTHI